MTKFHIIIPARYASTRLKAKILADIAGKPMIQHVYERALKSNASSITVATDDGRIAKAVNNFGGKVCLTHKHHLSGTSRSAEAAKILQFKKNDIVVCVQGDEPLIPPKIIDQVAKNLAEHREVKAATLCTKIISIEDIFNPNVVKVVMDRFDHALYFSRAPIPWNRKAWGKVSATESGFKIKFTGDRKNLNPFKNHYRHIGIYAYRVGFLEEYAGWEQELLEKEEALEQLKILWYGEKIHVAMAKKSIPPGVDTLKDLKTVQKLLKTSF